MTVRGISQPDMTESLTLSGTLSTGWHVDPHQICVFTFMRFHSQGSIDSSHVLVPVPGRVDRAGTKSDTNPCPCGADTLVDMPTTVYTIHPARERQTQECTCVRAYEHTVMSRAPIIRQSYICSFILPCRPLVSSCRWSPSSELALG